MSMQRIAKLAKEIMLPGGMLGVLAATIACANLQQHCRQRRRRRLPAERMCVRFLRHVGGGG